MPIKKEIQIITAPSILGLKPTGVEKLPAALLNAGLAKKIGSTLPIIKVPTLNNLYSIDRDSETNCLNPHSIKEFSISLENALQNPLDKNHFPLVLGGDCSILIGSMLALKSRGDYGLIFIDGHADFYEPEKSITGEVADMDLAIVSGRGPALLTNINNARPYVKDENIIHIGQRDQKETKRYNSQDIRDTQIKCFSYSDLNNNGLEETTTSILNQLFNQSTNQHWIHFDTDVLNDNINPAVDYRLPGGLHFEEMAYLLKALRNTGRIAGMTVTIYNPALDKDGSIGRGIVECIAAGLIG